MPTEEQRSGRPLASNNDTKILPTTLSSSSSSSNKKTTRFIIRLPLLLSRLLLLLVTLSFPQTTLASINSMSLPPMASSSVPSASAVAGSRQHTTRPITTGTSVLGIVYDKGVLLAADTLLSYGSMAKMQNVPRLKVIDNAQCILGASGEYSDFQQVVELLEQKALEEQTGLMDSLYDSKSLTASQIWNYLRFVMYSRRNKFNPYWNELIVAGTDSTTGQPFLGMIDKIGTTVKENYLATGFGGYLALPLLREKWRPNLTEGEARALLEDCLKVLFYRDCRASSRIQLAKAEGTETYLVSDPYDLETSWDAPSFMEAKADLDGDGGW